MESSPGPSTSSGSRPEVDLRAQTSAANTPRAGKWQTHKKEFKKPVSRLYSVVTMTLCLSRYAVYTPEGSAVKVDA